VRHALKRWNRAVKAIDPEEGGEFEQWYKALCAALREAGAAVGE
jgi:hypothetical protein